MNARVSLTLPQSLKKAVEHFAAKDGMSVYQFIALALAEKIGVRGGGVLCGAREEGRPRVGNCVSGGATGVENTRTLSHFGLTYWITLIMFGKEKEMKLLVGALVGAFVTSTSASAQSCQFIGDQMFCSGGLSSQTIGDTTFYSNGVTDQQIGDQTFGSDGFNSQQIGDQTFFSNGTSAQRIGDQTFFSDGTSCQQIGNQLFCN